MKDSAAATPVIAPELIESVRAMERHGGCMWDHIGEYHLCSPPVPKDKSTFLNPRTDRTRDQFFQHTALPTREEYEGWPLYRQQELEAQEWSRRDNGVWFWNQGVPTWIPGQYYYYLNYHRYGDEKPEYRNAHRRLYWVWALFVIPQRNCLGLFLHSRRRWGKTSIAASIGLEAASGNRNFRMGIQSKTDDDGQELFLNEVQAPFIAMQECPWFLPQTAGTNKPKSELLFDTPASRKRGAANTPDRLRGLRSKIDFRESTDTAYDSQKLNYFINDEVGKKQRFDPWARHSIVSKQFYPNGPVIGKEFAMTTSDENDDDSVAKGKEFWDKSDPALLPLRKGLARLFFPDYEGFTVDKYGYDTAASLQDLNDERLAAEQAGIVDWIRRRRAFPRSIQEAHLENVRPDCIFNQQHIGDCTTAIADYDATHARPLVNCYRLYEDPKTEQVIAVEDNTGRFRMSWLPPAQRLNKVKTIGSITTKLGDVPRRKPENAHVFGVSADPFDARETERAGSKGALHGMFLFDQLMEDRRGEEGYWPSHSFFVEYDERPANPEVYYEDCWLLIRWLGCKLFRETQKDNIGEYIIARGGADFLARAPVATLSEYQKTANKKSGAASSPLVIQQYTAAKQIFYQKYVGAEHSIDSPGGQEGLNDDGLPYDFRRMPFVKTMGQDILFDPTDPAIRKKSDLSVSHGFGLVQATGFIIKPPDARKKGLNLTTVNAMGSRDR